MTKKSNSTQNKIDTLDTEIEGLKGRLSDIDRALQEKKQSANFDDPDSLDDLKKLKQDKDLILEVIEEKQATLTGLKEELEAATANENRQDTISELIDLSESAEALQDEFRQKIHELDEILSERIPELVNIRSEWRNTAKAFMNLGESSGFGKGLSESTAYTYSRNGKADELNAENLIEELEQKGINLDAVLSDSVLRSQHFNHLRNSEPLEMNFGENLFRMMNQSNIPELLNED